MIRQQLNKIPARHTLIVGGGHNCGLMPSACAGPKADCGQGKPSSDQHLFQKLLGSPTAAAQLLELQGWPHLCTSLRAQPDRSCCAERARLTISPDRLHPPKTQLAAWRQGGKHLPVAGTIRLQAFQKLNRPWRPARGWDHWLAQRCNDWWDLQVSHFETSGASSPPPDADLRRP